MSEDVERRGLALPLSDDPMFDTNFCAGVRIGPASDITRCKDSRHARFEKGVNDHAAVDCEACVLGECNTRAHADTCNHEVGIELSATTQRDLFVIDVRHCFPKVEDHAMLLMQRTHEIAHLWSKDALHGTFSRSHHMHLNVARTESGRDFEPDEARTQHNGPSRHCRPL